MSFFMWKEDKEASQYDSASKEMEQFFHNLISDNKDITINGIKLTYRMNQHEFAKDILEAIRKKQLLVVQAGVGIGKSIGYIVPIFMTMKNVDNFENVIISTSSIGLQQQLLTDLNNVSNMLGINIKVAIAKGINNYVCIERLEKSISNSEAKDKEILKNLKEEINKKNTIDKDELINIENRLWEEVRMTTRGACSRCSYSRICLYKEISKKIDKASIIVTNHDYFANALLNGSDKIANADIVIFDEAHNLESSIRNIQTDTISYNKAAQILKYFYHTVDDENIRKYINETQKSINKLFDQIKRRGSAHYGASSEARGFEIEDCDKIPFSIGNMEGKLKNLIVKLNKLNNLIQNYYNNMGYRYDYRIKYLNNLKDLFNDMLKKDKSDNIYWASFYDKTKINIGYTCRDVEEVTGDIFNRKIPVICTSATMVGAGGDYRYFNEGLGIDKIGATDKTVVNGQIYRSPYNYEENSIFYYDKDITNPNNIDEYKEQLVTKISELIRITNGRALVLFTSKSIMDYVYDKIDKTSFDFKIMKQGQESNYTLSQKFEKNVKSCLFATGAFWEGIDIKGKSLCNVIITRLPFANVDAIMEAKASVYQQDAFNKVYLNDMIQKLTQGTGRLIRGGKDKGIVACLDSRFENYIEIVKKVTDFTNFTSDIKDLYDFSKREITNRDGARGPYGPRKIKKIESNYDQIN